MSSEWVELLDQLGVEHYERAQIVANPFDRPEWSQFIRHHLFADTIEEPIGGAGTRSMVQLKNSSLPTGRNAGEPYGDIIVVEFGSVFSVSGGEARLSHTLTTLATDDGFCQTRNTRDISGIPWANLRSETIAIPAGVSNGEFWREPGTILTLAFPIVLGPGFTLVAYSSVDQQVIRANWVGRVIHVGERTR